MQKINETWESKPTQTPCSNDLTLTYEAGTNLSSVPRTESEVLLIKIYYFYKVEDNWTLL